MKTSTEPLPFFKDRLIMLLLVISSSLAIVNTALVFIRLHSHDFRVPVQYLVRDGSVLQTSSWYSLYSLVIFSLFSAGATMVLSYRLHSGNRWFAVSLLSLYVVVGVITFIVTNALLGLVAGV